MDQTRPQAPIAEELGQGVPPALQFRLRTLFMLVTLAACVMFGTRVWHDVWLGDRGRYEEDNDGSLFSQCYRAQFLAMNRFTPVFAGLFFSGACGLWYARKRRDMAVGVGFGVPMALLLILPLGLIATFCVAAVLDWILDPFPYTTWNWLILAALVALAISAWPLVPKRYYLAGVLLLFNMSWICTLVCYGAHWLSCMD